MTLAGAVLASGNRQRWRVIKLRSLLGQSTTTGSADLPLLGVSVAAGVRARWDGDGRPAPSSDLSAYKLVRKGDVVMNALGKPHGSIGVSAVTGITSPAYWVMPVHPTADPRFIHYLLRSEHLIAEYQRLGKNQPPNQFDISWPQFRDIEVPVPPTHRQRAIADFLDRETARIDTLIEEQQRLIELLRERRQAVFSRAVDSSDSVARLGLMLDGIKDGTHGSFPRTAPGDGVPLLGARNVKAGRVVVDGDESYISDAHAAEITANEYPARGDVLLVIVGATIGKTAVYEFTFAHAFQRSVAFLRPGDKIDSRFLWLQIQSSRFQDELSLRSKVSAQPGIYLGDVAAIPVSAPPLAVQQTIASALTQEIGTLDDLIGETERFILVSRERRSALITAAVTGQIDVLGEQIAEAA